MAAGKGPDFEQGAGEAYRTWEKAMTAWWDQVLESPAFLGAMNDGLGAAATARGAYTRGVDQMLAGAHLPTRDDIVRLLRITTQVEEKLLAQEDLLLSVRDELHAAEKAALEARIQAAEARIELRERMDRIEARLPPRRSR